MKTRNKQQEGGFGPFLWAGVFYKLALPYGRKKEILGG